jgi:hypothetical protein
VTLTSTQIPTIDTSTRIILEKTKLKLSTVCAGQTPTSTRSAPNSLGLTNLSILTCAVVGTFYAANRPRTLSGNVRVSLRRRCGAFGGSISAQIAGRITSVGIGFEVT